MGIDDERGGSSFNIDIGASAKANLDIKGEIPSTSLGRAVDAFVDVFRPFTEKQGLKGDMLRLQREEVVLQIARIARERAEIENINLNPVPNKILVPLLEKASLEAETDNEMHKRWAALLLSASEQPRSNQTVFIDILSRLSGAELTLLEDVCFTYKNFPEMTYPRNHEDLNRQSVLDNINKLQLQIPDQTTVTMADVQREAKKIFEQFVESCKLTYGEIMYASVDRFTGGRSVGSFMHYSDKGNPGTSGYSSLELLEREGLIRFERVQRLNLDYGVGYFNVMPLGVNFVQACSPSAKEMASRRRPPIKVRA